MVAVDKNCEFLFRGKLDVLVVAGGIHTDRFV